MTRHQIQTAQLLASSALTEAREATTAAAARCCLETAASAVHRLSAAAAIEWPLIDEIQATRERLCQNGWDCWPELIG